MCVCLVYISMCSGGKGGQVFVLTRFNEGCVCFCVCARGCVFASERMCFHGEYTSRDMDGWKLPGLLYAPLRFLHSIFV